LARALLVAGIVGAIAGSAALMAGPWFTGLDPTSHSYPAIVWALVVWIVAHFAAGVIMQAYCLARSMFDMLTPQYDAELWNITLYWHFAAFCGVLTALVIGGFPLLT
jgi:heme/copper-type cytochrome/quinol oxidase subunit 3